jgi:hypothetical protein
MQPKHRQHTVADASPNRIDPVGVVCGQMKPPSKPFRRPVPGAVKARLRGSAEAKVAIVALQER